MKKLLCILGITLLLFCGCGDKTSDMDYTNIPLNYGSFHIGDIVYSLTPSGLTRYHANWEKGMNYFCTDPLCDHSGSDGVCPDCYELSGKSYATDGERIYMNARSYLPDHAGNIKRDNYQIYSFLPDGSDMKLLTSFDGSSGTQPNMRYHGGYLYFMQGFYEENGTSREDSYVHFMRVDTTNGKTEQALTEKYTTYDRLYLDDSYYYIVHMTGDVMTQALDILDHTGTIIEESVMPDGHAVAYLTTYDDITYAVCYDTREIITYANANTVLTYSLYRLDGTEFTRLVDNIGGDGTQLVFADGAFWYSPEDMIYHGTKEMPTGNGKETAPVDFISYTDGSLVRYDLKTAESRTWRADDAESEIIFLGISDDTAIIEIGNTAKEFRDGVSGKDVCKGTLNNDGTITINGKIEVGQ